ncbi:MAG: lyase family protein [Solirubrobacteraceae bacterium]|jgi:3-carboxy-cis,cis-muconate cycloisomerase
MSSEGLFDALYARGPVAPMLDGRGWLAAMLDVEAALARACAAEDLIPAASAVAISDACRVERFDLRAIAAAAGDSATPVIAIVASLRAAVGEEVAPHVHLGASSQDIIDTATMLLARRALEPLLADTGAAASAAAALADAHRGTHMAGRTLLQQAQASTFGLRAAGWLVGLSEAGARLGEIAAERLAVQMGGAVGARAPAVGARVAAELGLAEPTLPWGAIRVRPAELASALGVLAGVFAKIAGDVALFAQSEVGELREGGGRHRGGSSSMAHKRNPVASVSVIACTTRVPGLVATVLAAMAQEHDRAAGAWQAEWGTLTDLLVLVGSAAAWSADLLANLDVDVERMSEHAAGLDGDLGAVDSLIDRALGVSAR